MRPVLSRILRAAAIAAVLGATVAVVSADNADQNNNGSHYAWGENVGWLNARPSGDAYGPGGSGMQVSDTDVTGYLWGENIGWISLSCKNDNTCGGAGGNWGVRNDGAGHLSGYAWAENAGWISFSCSNNAATCAGTANYGVTINGYNVTTPHAEAGTFTGYAWGENIGWINFSCKNNPSTCASNGNFQVQTGAPDSDGDGYTDAQEAALTKNPFSFCEIMRADLNGDGHANIIDLSALSAQFLQTIPPGPVRDDQNGDNQVNIIDLTAASSVFLESVSACP